MSVSTGVAPLGPGDDDPRSPAKGVAAETRGPLGPGESAGPNPDEGFDFLAPPPPGPGDAAGGARRLVRIPKRQPPPEAASEQD